MCRWLALGGGTVLLAPTMLRLAIPEAAAILPPPSSLKDFLAAVVAVIVSASIARCWWALGRSFGSGLGSMTVSASAQFSRLMNAVVIGGLGVTTAALELAMRHA